MAQIEGIIEDEIKLVGYTMEHNGVINNTYWYNDWTGSDEESSFNFNTNIKVREFSHTSSESDISGPELIFIEEENISQDNSEFSITVENSGSSGHRFDDYSMDLYPVTLFLFHEDNSGLNIDDAFALEFYGLPSIENVYATYKTWLDYNDLPEKGLWSVKAIQLIDHAGNVSYYYAYSDEIYSGQYNFWNNDFSYYLFNFSDDLPCNTEIQMVTIEKKSRPDIYVAGYYNMDSSFSKQNDHEKIPCVWKNGELLKLELNNKTFASPQSISATQNKIYTAGYAYSENDSGNFTKEKDALACLWIGKKIHFLEQNYYSKAYFHAASPLSDKTDKNNIYASGYYRNNENKYIACYWTINGEHIYRTDIISGSIIKDNPTRAVSISTSKDYIYITGNYTDGANNKLFYWKYDNKGNMLEENLMKTKDSDKAAAVSMYTSGDDIYIASDYKDFSKIKSKICLWMNGNQNIIDEPFDLSVSSIFVSDNIIYVSGNYKNLNNKKTACYWQITDNNIDRVDLGIIDKNYTSSIYVYENNIYISGGYVSELNGKSKKTACYWKNDNKQDLFGYENHNAGARAIIIVE